MTQVRSAGAAGININHIYRNQHLITAVHNAGLSVWTWTVDDKNRLQELLDLGVDSITTNWVEPMRQMMKSGAKKHGGT
ncbi:MAG: hypothetical protein IMY75_07760 [Chloroflexi bacterium]|nr:hypothetical protein [Chloroflexota bacterium]